MSLETDLRLECIKIGSTARTKKDVLKEISQLLCNSPLLSAYSPGDLYAFFESREKIVSTSIGDGIAIPHCTLDDIDDFAIGVLTVPNGVDFESIDGKPAYLFFFFVGPNAKRSKHVQILSAISNLLKDRSVFDQILNASSQEEVKNLILSKLQYHESAEAKKEMSLFTIFVQKQEYFDEILALLTSLGGNAISVIESNNPGFYLSQQPVYAAYWKEGSIGFNRIILATVDKAKANDVIRRINMITDTFAEASGVFIAVSELCYTSGRISF
ncbi:MAG TPA: PTS sugar transporter subunit IIA [Spirochaetia bacterium]|nr:PTS sugar transporter subunit IIA [Spirochaetia bacterium]